MIARITLVGCLIASSAAAAGERQIRFKNGDIDLAGSLLMPQGTGPFPSMVLLHGSGPETRDSLRPIAQRLVDAGFAALIFDKRGTGGSSGSWLKASLDDLARDGAAALRALTGQAEVDRGRAGLLAISQSGWYAPLVAAVEPSVRFLVVVTGGGAAPREVEWFGYERRLQRANVSPGDVEKARRALRIYFDYLATGEGWNELQRALDEGKGSAWVDALQLERTLPSPRERSSWAWVATFDPVPAIEKMRIPVLLLFGGHDDLLPTDLSMERWATALRRSEATATIREFPEAGHGLTLGAHHDSAAHVAPRFAVGYFEMVSSWLAALRLAD